MPAGLTFYKDLQRREGDKTSNPGEAKVIVYEDGGGNKYTLDASSVSGLSGVDDIKLSNLLKAEVKFKYHPSGGREAETKGLGNIISTLFATKSASTADSKTILEEEVAKKPVAEAILGAKDGKKSILVEELGKALDRVANDANDKVYGDDSSHLKIAKDFLADKYPLAKIDATNLTDANNKKAFAKAILPALDDKKSILVEELGKALDRVANDANDKVYGQTGHEKIAKDFLAEKGLKPTPAELKEDSDFVSAVRVAVNAEEIREVMSKPVFEIPADDNAPLSWDW